MGRWLVRMEWHPAGLSVCLALISQCWWECVVCAAVWSNVTYCRVNMDNKCPVSLTVWSNATYCRVNMDNKCPVSLTVWSHVTYCRVNVDNKCPVSLTAAMQVVGGAMPRWVNTCLCCCVLLHFTWVVDNAKCIVFMRVSVCLSVCPRPHAQTIARTWMYLGGVVGDVPSYALLGRFAIGARVVLLWQHNANAKC